MYGALMGGMPSYHPLFLVAEAVGTRVDGCSGEGVRRVRS